MESTNNTPKSNGTSSSSWRRCLHESLKVIGIVAQIFFLYFIFAIDNAEDREALLLMLPLCACYPYAKFRERPMWDGGTVEKFGFIGLLLSIVMVLVLRSDCEDGILMQLIQGMGSRWYLVPTLASLIAADLAARNGKMKTLSLAAGFIALPLVGGAIYMVFYLLMLLLMALCGMGSGKGGKRGH